MKHFSLTREVESCRFSYFPDIESAVVVRNHISNLKIPTRPSVVEWLPIAGCLCLCYTYVARRFSIWHEIFPTIYITMREGFLLVSCSGADLGSVCKRLFTMQKLTRCFLDNYHCLAKQKALIPSEE